MPSMASFSPPQSAARRVNAVRCRRSLWKRLRRNRDFRRLASTATLWMLTVAVMWVVLEEIIK
ncbi:MAG TPA: hypothetical protein VE734_09370 [Terriglobales bacterium]|nr:hypothetical protein [Terriglobales bacterium]